MKNFAQDPIITGQADGKIFGRIRSKSKGLSKPSKWWGAGLLSFFSVFQFVLQGSVGVMGDSLKRSLSLDAAALSILSSCFFYSYIVMQIPVGLIYDRFGLKKVAATALGLVGLSCVLFSVKQNYYFLILCRILMGTGCAFGFVGMLTAIRSFFPPQKFAMMAAIAESLCMVSVAIANTLLGQGVVHFGPYVTMAICGSFTVPMIYLILTKVPEENIQTEHSQERSQEESKVLTWREKAGPIFQLKEIWLGGAFSAFIFSVVTVFATLWGIPFFSKAYNLNLVNATSLISAVYVGIAISSLFIGHLAARFSLITLMIIGSIFTFGTMFILVYGPVLSLSLAYFLMFSLGCACSVYQLSFALVSEKAPKKIQSSALGTTNMICMLSAPILQPFIGLLLSSTKGEGAFDGLEFYTASQYRLGLSPIMLGLFFAILIAIEFKRPFMQNTLRKLKKVLTSPYKMKKKQA